MPTPRQRIRAARPRRVPRTQSPEFRELTPDECNGVLGRNHVGRLAFWNDVIVDIEPLGYVARDGWIFLRSAPGTKIHALRHNPYVAFEVDEVDGPFDWRSVVVHGTIYMLPVDGPTIEQRAFQRAVNAFRERMPATLTAADPVPERNLVYGVHVQRLEGRAASSRD